ncbi:hypothetical protein [Neochlamydia sp. AcF84]|uniref:lipase family protein n=1 Tax=Neochlamydia sp. AcF84 TaxID=2315858 RepID=UPI001409BBA0|nr:hypothetical protein [Neochlamydia sp. AcF84]
MCAYVFKPVDENEKAPPILAFSGTRIGLSQRGFLATLAADFDPRGVSYIAYASGKRNITQWLEQNKNALVTGHSLGGALARYTAIDNPSLVHGVFSFNAPGISATYGKKWDQLKTELPQCRPQMQRFVGIIPFIFFISLLFINQALFSLYDSRPYVSVFGPLCWVWRQLITSQLAIKQLDVEYSLSQGAAIAA